jgi:hypothetical protein
MKTVIERSNNSYAKIIRTGSSQGGVMITIFASSYSPANDLAGRNI